MVDKEKLTNIGDLARSTMEGRKELAELALEAMEFLQWHRWCKSVQHAYLDRGWPGVLAVFYFEIETSTRMADNDLWVVVGDLPPAYLDVASCPNGAIALESYVYAMQEWVDHVYAKQSLEDVIPVYRRHSLVRVKPTAEYAKQLANRLDFIRTKILPDYEELTE